MPAGWLQQECVAKYLEVRADNLLDDAHDVLIEAQRTETVISLHQALDLPNPVAGVLDLKFSPLDARLDLEPDRATVTVPVCVLTDSVFQSRNLVRREQVLDDNIAVAMVVSHLFGGGCGHVLRYLLQSEWAGMPGGRTRGSGHGNGCQFLRNEGAVAEDDRVHLSLARLRPGVHWSGGPRGSNRRLRCPTASASADSRSPTYPA